MSTFKFSFPNFLFGLTVGILAFLAVESFLSKEEAEVVVPIISDKHCIESLDAVASFMEEGPSTLINYYKNWTMSQDLYKTQALNIPADVVNSLFVLLKNNPTFPGSGTPRAGVRVYYGSTSTISPTAMPTAADTRMILWPLNNTGNVDLTFPQSALPILNTPAKFELPCPQYCD